MGRYLGQREPNLVVADSSSSDVGIASSGLTKLKRSIITPLNIFKFSMPAKGI